MIELGQYSSSFDKRDEHVNVNAIWLNQARPFFGVNREAWDPRMGNKVGDTFSNTTYPGSYNPPRPNPS